MTGVIIQTYESCGSRATGGWVGEPRWSIVRIVGGLRCNDITILGTDIREVKIPFLVADWYFWVKNSRKCNVAMWNCWAFSEERWQHGILPFYVSQIRRLEGRENSRGILDLIWMIPEVWLPEWSTGNRAPTICPEIMSRYFLWQPYQSKVIS